MKNPYFTSVVFVGIVIAYLLLACPGVLFVRSSFADDALLQASIQKAGNADDDGQRLEILKALRKDVQMSPMRQAELDRLIAEIERWIDSPRLEYFGREVLKNEDWNFDIPPDSPFMPLTYLYRARMILWCAMEHGGIWGVQEKRNEYFAKAAELLRESKKVFPENRITRMYLGEPIVSPPYETVENAPLWAVYQREGLQRLADIVTWWIDRRLQENGEYGGGWGDDCEMWRVWVPVLIAFDDPKISSAQAFFSDAILSQPHMKGGYTSRLSDVEHTAEDSADAMTPMMHLDPGNPVWKKRALRLVDLMENLWTGTNERDFLQFKSTYFTSEKVDTSSARACDSVYHPRAMQPALLYWQRTGDKRLGRLFSAWMDTWVDATARAERGKPAGIIPSAIHWPSGTIGGTGKNWWKPENYKEKLYDWPSSMSMMTHTMLLAYHLTGKDQYLDPIRSMARIRMNYLDSPPAENPPPGSEAWCASRISLNHVLAKYRFLTGNDEFDTLLAKEQTPYYSFRQFGDRDQLISALKTNAEAFSINFPGFTSEVRYTDRLIRFPALFGSDLFRQPGVSIPSPDPALLYSTATGDPGGVGYFPLNAVRWLTPPRDIAALVTQSGRKGFSAQLFHFGNNPRPMYVEFYLLDPGLYWFLLHPKDESSKIRRVIQPLSVSGPLTKISFDLPPREEMILTIKSGPLH